MKKGLIIGAIVILVIIVIMVFNGNSNNKETQTTGEEQTETETPSTTKSGKQISLGESIEDDTVKLIFNEFEVETEYKFTYTDKSGVGTSIKHSGIDEKSGMKIVCLRGKLTNKTSNEIYTSNNFIKGEVIINGNTYKTILKCFDVEHAESFSALVAQQETDCFLYAEVPQSVADNIETCTFDFGYMKDFDTQKTVFAEKIKDFDCVYTIKVK